MKSLVDMSDKVSIPAGVVLIFLRKGGAFVGRGVSRSSYALQILPFSIGGADRGANAHEP
jgi:hypothetical protein